MQQVIKFRVSPHSSSEQIASKLNLISPCLPLASHSISFSSAGNNAPFPYSSLGDADQREFTLLFTALRKVRLPTYRWSMYHTASRMWRPGLLTAEYSVVRRIDQWAAYCLFIAFSSAGFAQTEAVGLHLRHQTETGPGSGRFHQTIRTEKWKAEQTAVIVCDVWDSHHCVNAVRRVNELAPRIDRFVAALRERGALVVHAPSGCMDAYSSHPARKRAETMPKAKSIPSDIGRWCDQIPAEEKAAYPLDQSKGGEDDDLAEHQLWAARLAAEGRNPKSPWLKQIGVIGIDEKVDFISDRGEEIWSIFESKGIQNVILTGVHTNMCVLGRPFGLRQLSSHGKNVVLARDLTDTMYDPSQWPYVSHFSGTDLIVDHIERFVCPTITSDQILGGRPFRFSGDRRPRLAMLIAEDEYKTEVSLPRFAAEHLGKHFSVSMFFGSEANPHLIPGIQSIDDADALLVSVRRRPLPLQDLERVRKFVAQGKPVIGIRTASHAFSLRNQQPADGLTAWPEFDSLVLGGNYTNHFGNNLFPAISREMANATHPIAKSLSTSPFTSHGSLYKVLPLARGTQVLLNGEIPNESKQPVAWTFVRNDGGRSFYTSLGHPDDFALPEFRQLLVNAIHWSCDLSAVTQQAIQEQTAMYASGKGQQR